MFNSKQKLLGVILFAFTASIVMLSQALMTVAEINANATDLTPVRMQRRGVSVNSSEASAAFQKVLGIFFTAATVATSTPPTNTGFYLMSPYNNAALSGTVTLQASADENLRVIAVQFIVDGEDYGLEATTTPFSTSLDTKKLTNGAHTVSARSRDNSNTSFSARTVNFTVSNDADFEIKNLSASVSQTSATLTWDTTRSATVEVDWGTTFNFGATARSKYARKTSHKLTLAQLSPKTTYYVRVHAVDVNYNSVYKPDFTFVTNDEPVNLNRPTVYMMEPANNAYVSGTVSVRAYARDADSPAGVGSGSGISKVIFQADGMDIGEATAKPYTISFDTSTLDSGSHTLSAIALDMDGNSVVSVPITINKNSVQPASGSGSAATAPDSSTAKLVNSNGTYYLIASGKRYGITDPGVLASYGFEFKDAKTATSADISVSQASLLAPGDGSLVKKRGDPTVWFVTSGQKYGFTAAAVFTGLGFQWKNVREVSAEVLDSLPQGANLSDANAKHLPGVYISAGSTIYRVTATTRRGVPSMEVYNSWNVDNDFSQVVPANAADLSVPVGDNLTQRQMQ